MDSDSKPTNPKDAIGSTKLSMGLVPDSLRAFAALAFTEGALKYGRYNWRLAGVRSSIYRDAIDRHLSAWWNGEDTDPGTGIPHLASVLACVGIILDADVSDTLTDDRPPRQPMLKPLIDAMSDDVARLKGIHADKHPYQYTIKDTRE